MKITPIIFSGPMVRALLDGRKSQTRRIVKPQPYMQELEGSFGGRLLCFQERGSPGTGLIWPNAKERILSQCPYGQPGDLLYVRETWGYWPLIDQQDEAEGVIYRADDDDWQCRMFSWRPSIHMPRRYSRLTLELTDVRVERLNDISDADALAEGLRKWPHKGDFAYGCDGGAIDGHGSATGAFRSLWESINGPGSWNRNDWIWALSFRIHHCNVDHYSGRAA